MIRITEQYFWSGILLLFYVSLLVVGVIILETEAYRSYSDLTWIDLTLLLLAAERLVRLVAEDSLFKFFREQFYTVKTTARSKKVTLEYPKRGFSRMLLDLIYSPSCLGLWMVSTVTFFYLLTPYAYFVVIALALSSAVSFLHIFFSAVAQRG